jgi:hypothetical protein
MEDCMIEQPCGMCGRVWCNCPPEPEDQCPCCGAHELEACQPDCEIDSVIYRAGEPPEIDWTGELAADWTEELAA